MSKRKLLLADDSATIQKVVNLAFADEGIEVNVVADGDSALEKIAENAPDLILADVGMPGIGGYEICEFIKQDEKTKHIPVILLVGSFEPFDEEKARSVGADDYMTKPFKSIRQLVTKVSGLLNTAEDAAASDGAAKKATIEDSSAETSAVESLEDASESVSAETDGDAPIDQETVQTNQIGSLPVDEAERFSSALPGEISEQSLTDDFDEGDETRMQSLNAAEPTETVSSDADDSATAETDSLSENSFAAAQSYGRISEPDSNDDDSAIDTYEESADNLPVNPPTNPFAGIELDEMNLLELSFDDDDEFYEFEDEPIEESGLTQFVEAGESALPEPSESKVSYTAREFHSGQTTVIPAEQEIYAAEITEPATGNQASFDNISPALIEAIAARVVEKLSDRVIREIAAEVVPQMADSIIQQMARDEFNN